MSLLEITNKVNELASNWEQFKVLNDRRLKEVETKGSADPITLNHLEKLNNVISQYDEKLSSFETALKRPSLESKAEYAKINDAEHKAAFLDYLRKGADNNLLSIEQKSLSNNDRNSGYLVTSKIYSLVLERQQALSPMRRVASVVEISTDALEVIEDKAAATAGWTLEADSSKEANIIQVSKRVIPVHELYAQPKATQKLIDDSSIDVEAWIANKIVDIFSRMENQAFISGDGSGKPKGILSFENGKEWGKIEQIKSGASGKITPESLFNLFYSMKEIYSPNAKFIMSRDAVQMVRMLKDTSNGKYLWQPGLALGTPDTLLGAEVLEAADMPAVRDGSLSIAFGDFKTAYQIVDRQDMRILRDPFTHKPFVKFYTTKRVGGDVVNFEAIKLLKLSA